MSKTIAITRPVSQSIDQCALTYMERVTIDVDKAQEEHSAYEECLRQLGLEIVRLPAAHDLPDAVFVEDTAVVVDEAAVVTRPKLPARQTEVDSMASVLEQYRPLEHIEEDGTLEGGDVIRIDRVLYVGLSARTNQEGIRQLGSILAPYGYEVRAVPVERCLHLKTAATYIGRNTILANPQWVDVHLFTDLDAISVAAEEPEAGNALLVDKTVLLPANFPYTAERLRDRGFTVQEVESNELQKAESGLTCCSVIFPEQGK